MSLIAATHECFPHDADIVPMGEATPPPTTDEVRYHVSRERLSGDYSLLCAGADGVLIPIAQGWNRNLMVRIAGLLNEHETDLTWITSRD